VVSVKHLGDLKQEVLHCHGPLRLSQIVSYAKEFPRDQLSFL
jgi:hypothetical protein